jgi:uncharacterized protein (DUF983 family)
MTDQPTVSLSTAALKGCCPRCGQGALFDGFIKIADKCDACGLGFAGHDTGDGPAFFIILPLSLIVAGLALWLDLSVAPPLWVHFIIWPVFVLGVTFLALRPIKAVMVALQYRHRDVEHYDDSAQQ